MELDLRSPKWAKQSFLASFASMKVQVGVRCMAFVPYLEGCRVLARLLHRSVLMTIEEVLEPSIVSFGSLLSTESTTISLSYKQASIFQRL